MNRSLFLAVVIALPAACTPSLDTGLRPSRAAVLENQLMQADRDFQTATHTRGIDGWMSYYTPDAIRIVYGGGMVKGLEAIRKLDAPYVADPASVINWEPLEAHAYRYRPSGARPQTLTNEKTPYPFRYGAATGGPPVLLAQPVAIDRKASKPASTN